jgi:hypothetical protein
MENYEALLALGLLKQPIAEYFRVFSNPMYMLNAHLAEPLAELLRDYVFFRTQQSSSRVLWQSLNALLVEYQESLMILASIRTHIRVLLNASLCIYSIPTWQSFYRTPTRVSVCNCVLLHSLASWGVQ